MTGNDILFVELGRDTIGVMTIKNQSKCCIVRKLIERECVKRWKY